MSNSFLPNNQFMNGLNFPLPGFAPVGNPNVIYESLSSFQAVKEYQIPAGKVGLLFDNNKNEFYWKDVDSHGMQTLKRFRYEEIPLPADSVQLAENNQQEIETLNKRLAGMENMLSQFLQGQKVPESDQKGREK